MYCAMLVIEERMLSVLERHLPQRLANQWRALLGLFVVPSLSRKKKSFLTFDSFWYWGILNIARRIRTREAIHRKLKACFYLNGSQIVVLKLYFLRSWPFGQIPSYFRLSSNASARGENWKLPAVKQWCALEEIKPMRKQLSSRENLKMADYRSGNVSILKLWIFVFKYNKGTYKRFLPYLLYLACTMGMYN